MARRTGSRRRIGVLIAVLAAVLIAALGAPARFPDLFGLALPFEAILPWLGAPIALLLIAALARRAWLGILVSLLAVVVWSFVFVPRIMPLNPPSASEVDATVTVLSQNLQGAAGDPATTTQAVLDRAPDLLALQEIDGESRDALDAALLEAYPYAERASTVGLWSTYPILESEPLDLGLGWKRALRAVVATPGGDTTVYVVHAASARLQGHEQRDQMLTQLTEQIQADGSPRIIALGDFNAGTDDRSFVPLTDLLVEPRQTAGGFGFSWPAAFPFVRLDHVLERGFDARSMETIPLGGSDHLAVTAELVLTQ
ncbi:endonuclease/exonuclease/phosphatase family protein [Leucobacter luti]|uniref:endonuclease/exonuclease/phosphatase family protein n=1 Tax=Leucobacter luti TaxID=340320 RepID=UPI001C6941AF|nr:endonuclease/exonuclease/phosphatase family protein [Leucobacter luti]QYM75960.1 endonuclease/exonuclease/phosphatase family protein [Leucobacter luti]